MGRNRGERQNRLYFISKNGAKKATRGVKSFSILGKIEDLFQVGGFGGCRAIAESRR